MKATSIFRFVLSAMAFVVAVCVSQELGELVQHTQAHDLFHTAPILGMATVSFANLDGSSYQTPNPGGNRLLLILQAKDFAAIWPTAASITAGEVATAPTFVATAKFATYALPDGTFSLTDSQDGDPGYQSYKHSAGFSLAGFSKTLVAELKKHLNAGSVIIGEMNDGQYAVIGSSDNPIYVKAAFNSGAKGADKRGYTLKGEADGFMWGVTPIKAEIAAALPLLPQT